MTLIKHKNGFTLLELLLIIILFSVIAMSGIATYQLYSTRAKVERTAKQMQQILEAASSYFIDYGCWPGDSSCPSNAPAFNQYMTVSAINPWGQNYSYSNVSNTKKFQVLSGNLPSSAVSAQVAALLPSAVINGQQVLTQIAIPAKIKSSQVNSKYMISVIGQTPPINNKDGYILNMTCPPGTIANVVFTPTNIQPETYSTCLAGNITFNNIYTYGACALTNPANNTWTCIYSVNFVADIPVGWLACAGSTGDWNGGRVAFSYIGWCYNPKLGNKKTINNKQSAFHLF